MAKDSKVKPFLQTIDLYTYDLETTEFAPSEAKRARPIKEAEQAVNQYFDPLSRVT